LCTKCGFIPPIGHRDHALERRTNERYTGKLKCYGAHMNASRGQNGGFLVLNVK